MDSIREYLIGVVAAALICSVVTSLINNKTAIGISVKFIAGLLMVLAVVRPWMSVTVDGLFDWSEKIGADGMGYISDGEIMAKEAYRAGIKQRVETYILDEAKALDCALTVDVILSDEDMPVPKTVTLSGEISPYARQVITTLLTERLGIRQEDQIWT